VEPSNESLMTRYLLKELSQEEEDRFEQKYFSDDQVFEELQVAEAELIDSYARGALSESERRQFLRFYLTSAERRKKVEDAECLMAALVQAAAEKAAVAEPQLRGRLFNRFRSPLFSIRLGYAMAMVVVLAFAFVATLENRRLHSELTRLRTKETVAIGRSQNLEAKSNLADVPGANESHGKIAQPEGAESLIASLGLRSGMSRDIAGGTSNKLRISPGIRWVRLSLLLEHDEHYLEYTAVVQTVNGDEIERVDRLKSETQAGLGTLVELQMPADLLAGDTYVVKLLGITKNGNREDVDEYAFQAVRRER
jgi:anti-sigma factor RsiW